MPTIFVMGKHSVAEAKTRLSDLVGRSPAGEAVVITRHGYSVVELKPVRARTNPVTAADLDRLAPHRAEMNARVDAGTFVTQMGDEEERSTSTSTPAQTLLYRYFSIWAAAAKVPGVDFAAA